MPLSQSRGTRDQLLYGNADSVVNTALLVKAYVSAAFGNSSQLYKQIKVGVQEVQEINQLGRAILYLKPDCGTDALPASDARATFTFRSASRSCTKVGRPFHRQPVVIIRTRVFVPSARFVVIYKKGGVYRTDLGRRHGKRLY